MSRVEVSWRKRNEETSQKSLAKDERLTGSGVAVVVSPLR